MLLTFLQRFLQWVVTVCTTGFARRWNKNVSFWKIWTEAKPEAISACKLSLQKHFHFKAKFKDVTVTYTIAISFFFFDSIALLWVTETRFCSAVVKLYYLKSKQCQLHLSYFKQINLSSSRTSPAIYFILETLPLHTWPTYKKITLWRPKLMNVRCSRSKKNPFGSLQQLLRGPRGEESEIRTLIVPASLYQITMFLK